MTPNDPKPLPCPFCACQTPVVRGYYATRSLHCPECEAVGPAASKDGADGSFSPDLSSAEAVRLWNTRKVVTT